MSGVEMAMIAAAGAQIGGKLIGGISAYQNSRLQSELTKREGDQALATAQVEQDIALTEGERAMGEARASAGASGLDLSGSASDIFARLGAERSAAAATSLYEGASARDAAYFEARQIKKAGQAALTSAVLDATATAISAGVNMAGAGAGAEASGDVPASGGYGADKRFPTKPGPAPKPAPPRPRKGIVIVNDKPTAPPKLSLTAKAVPRTGKR